MDEIEIPCNDLPPPMERAVFPVKKWGVGMAMALSGILAGYVMAEKQNIAEQLFSKTSTMTVGPYVHTSIATRGSRERILKLLGETRPYATVTLYGKVSGYLRTIVVDKGDQVKKGQVLATIDSPETFNRYAAGIVDAKNKRKVAERTKELHRQKFVSDQDLETATANADMAEAQLAELNAKKGFSIVEAPFDGIVTARFADPGALVQNAASSQTSALPIVAVSQTNKLRITLYLDQRDAPFVKVGDKAEIAVEERPDAIYEAQIARKSGELDPLSRTMLTEIELDNTHDEIVAGSFVDVRLRIRTPSQIQIPSEALIIRGGKPSVAVIDHDGILHYRDVKTGDSDGKTLTILAGLDDGDAVGLNLGNNLLDGQHVQPIREQRGHE